MQQYKPFNLVHDGPKSVNADTEQKGGYVTETKQWTKSQGRII